MNWDTIAYNIEQFWNKPIPIIGFTVGAVIIGVLVILAKTSIGKKTLNDLKLKYDIMKRMYNEAIEAKDNIIKEEEKIIAEMKQEYEDKLALIQAEKDKEKEIIIAIAENINNVKIKKIIEDYKQLPEIECVSQHINNIKKEYESKYEKVLEEIEQWKNHQVN